MKTFLLTTATYLALASAAFAGPFQYECTIERLMFDDDDMDEAFWLKKFQSSKLYIERSTGAVFHPEITVTSTDQISKSMVISQGNGNTYYKSISISINGFMTAVNVQEFASGSKKPMALLESGKVMTGYCY